MVPAFHADALARLPLVANVNFTGRIGADEHRGEAGNGGVVLDEFGDLDGDLALNCPRERFSIQQLSGHKFPRSENRITLMPIRAASSRL